MQTTKEWESGRVSISYSQLKEGNSREKGDDIKSLNLALTIPKFKEYFDLKGGQLMSLFVTCPNYSRLTSISKYLNKKIHVRKS